MIKYKVKKVMVPYDFSANADKAISHAAIIASLNKSDLYLVHVISRSEVLDIILPMLKLKTDKGLADIVNKRLEEVAAKIRKTYGIIPKTLVSSGSVTTEITNLAEENNIDLIVMGTQGKDSKSDLFLGSTAYRLVTKAPMPVMTIKGNISKKGYQKILLPVDLTRHSRQKVNYAIGFAKTFGAKITVLGLYEEDEREDKGKLELIVKQIKDLCDKSKVSCSTYVDKTKHRVSKTITFAKKHKNDLIITMTNQKIESSKGILSSYNHELVHNSNIPVISIEPEINPNYKNVPTGLAF